MKTIYCVEDDQSIRELIGGFWRGILFIFSHDDQA